jgi:tellurite resistance protein TehA-like permease
MRSRTTGDQAGIAVAAARVIETIPPGAGAVVMGTGIVSIDLFLSGARSLSLVPLLVATIAWALLGILLAGRLLWDRPRFQREATLPAALTGVAGTAVLGTRLTLLGWGWAGAVMLGIAGLLWLALVGRVLRHWATPTVGVSFMVTVSTQSLTVLLAVLGSADRAVWLVVLAVAPLTLGAGLYAVVVSRFDVRQLVRGSGDQWVAGGALAISALACARVTEASQTLHVLGDGAALRAATLVLWVAAMAWLPFLVVTELTARRILYDTRRWATVFPVGMYAACGFLAASALGWGGLSYFAQVWSWVALAVWVVVLVAMLWQPIPLVRAAGSPLPRTGDEPAEG